MQALILNMTALLRAQDFSEKDVCTQPNLARQFSYQVFLLVFSTTTSNIPQETLYTVELIKPLRIITVIL